MRRPTLMLSLSLSLSLSLALALAGCATSDAPRGMHTPTPVQSAQREPDEREAADADPLLARAGIAYQPIEEAFVTAATPQDNIDSPAVWRAPNGRLWLLATAKQGGSLLVYDGDQGTSVARYGHEGEALGEFRRPNGIAVLGDLVFVVERDNRRVQVLSLSLPEAPLNAPGIADTRTPRLRPLTSFGGEQLRQPYGLWVRKLDASALEVIVTDAYMAGEDADGNEIAPPLEQLGRRMQRYRLDLRGERPLATPVGAFGDTGAEGAIRVPESIWGDPAHDRLLIAEEDLATGTAIREYGLDGRYRGRTIGLGLFKAQAEGIALWQCDDGSGYWIATDQYKDRSLFHVFDRASLRHLGAFAGRTVGNTDGVWLQQSGSVRFPDGVFYAVHDDQAVGAFDWRDIARALNLRSRCQAR